MACICKPCRVSYGTIVKKLNHSGHMLTSSHTLKELGVLHRRPLRVRCSCEHGRRCTC